MKMRSILGALVIISLPAMPVWAENLTPEEIKKLVDEAVEKRLQERDRHQAERQGPTEAGTGLPSSPPGPREYPGI
ncbi:MAG: hypothetical protein A4E19_19175 [Nitrospira sp. SG-bin1]|nr:MAG: hypothetical protein A4E19_19175 [Nitrospira sp. SG-bin1]